MSEAAFGLARLREKLERGAPAGITGEFLRFGVVGASGFVLDAVLLLTLVQLFRWDPYVARVFSFLCGTALTWILNRLFTFFRRAGAKRRREYVRYLGVQVVSGALNLGVYATLLSLVPALQSSPLVALAAGSFCAMWPNFFGARHFAFDKGGKAVPRAETI
jgi:putative flippase GtrA